MSKDVTIINDRDIEGAGAVVFWNLSGATDYEGLVDAWEDHGLPAERLVGPATASAAMRSAAKDCTRYLPEGYFVRNLGKHAFALVRETRDGDDAQTSEEDYAPVLKIGITVTPIEDGDGKVIDHRVSAWHKYKVKKRTIKKLLGDYVETFMERFEQARGEISLHNMDWWIKKVMSDYVHTVNLGERGKPFYVAPDRMDRWLAVRSAISEAQPAHKFRQIPAMRGDDVAEAVLDACAREVQKQTERIYEELDREDGDEAKPLGKRALAGRQTQLSELLDKMQSFETLLGDRLVSLRDDIEECKATVVHVAVALDEEDE